MKIDFSICKHNFEAVELILDANAALVLNHGAEIGVRRGLFSEYLLGAFPALTMICVDPYEPYEDVGTFFNEEMQGRIMIEAFNRLEQFNTRVVWNLGSSVVAARCVKDGELDFAFIDGAHTYLDVRADLKAWLPKIRKGGLLCGHDYEMPQVRSAVDFFAGRHGLTVEASGMPGDVWWMGV